MKRCCRQLNVCWLQSNGRWDGMHWWQAICHKGLTNNKNPQRDAYTHSGVTSLGTHHTPQHDWGSRIQHLHLGQGGGDRFQCHGHDFSQRWLLPPSSWRRGWWGIYRPPHHTAKFQWWSLHLSLHPQHQRGNSLHTSCNPAVLRWFLPCYIHSWHSSGKDYSHMPYSCIHCDI